MQQARTRAIQTLKGGRNFSSCAQRPAVSPFKRPAQAATAKVVEKDVRRPQSTAAAATQSQQRSRPAPAFNREDYANVQPLKPYRSPEMDHSFVGMTGGEIFHEMMLRQGVKHICTAFSILNCCH
jgi:acetolactate synthase-1/2/3 large subunit